MSKEKQPDLIINDELKDFLDNLRAEEVENLEALILRDGIRDPIVVWDEENTIVDGHNRWGICQKHNIIPKIERISFDDIEAVKDWMLENQLGRRNLSPTRFDYYLGKLYERRKGAGNEGRVSEEIAATFGKSERTIRRAGDFSAGTDKLEKILGKIEKEKVLSNRSDFTKEQIQKVGKTKNTTRAKKLVNRIKDENAAKKAVKQAQKDRSTTKYNMVFINPDFENDSIGDVQAKKPAIADNATLFMLVEDYDLGHAFEIIRKWNFMHEASIVIIENERAEIGTYTKLKHQLLLIASKGIVPGPKKGKEPDSIIRSENPLETAFNILEGFATAGQRIAIDLDRDGWD